MPIFTLNTLNFFTDHKPPIGLKLATSTNISSQLTNWALLLQEHNYELIYTKETQNKVADELSRKPLTISFYFHY